MIHARRLYMKCMLVARALLCRANPSRLLSWNPRSPIQYSRSLAYNLEARNKETVAHLHGFRHAGDRERADRGGAPKMASPFGSCTGFRREYLVSHLSQCNTLAWAPLGQITQQDIDLRVE